MAVSGRVFATMRRPDARRRFFAMADQGVFSLNNILVFILATRSFSSDEAVGAFSLAMVAYVLLVGGLRSVVGEPLLSLYSPVGPSERRRVVADLQGTVLFLGCLCSVALGVLSWWIGGISGSALLALAFVIPVVLYHDAWRYVFIIDRPAAAFAIDMVWLVSVVVALPLAPDGAGVSWFVVTWGLCGALGAVAGTVLGWGLPGRPHPWRWLVVHRETSSRFFGEFLTAQAAGQVVLVALGAIAGLGALGTAKASQVFYGPLNTVHAGIYLATVPEGTRSRANPARLRRLCLTASVILAGAALLWMLVGALVPEAWGTAVFGREVWSRADDLMLPMGLAMMAGGSASGGLVGVRSLGDARLSLAARLRSAPWQVVCPLIGAVLGGAFGFALGFGAGHLAASVIWWGAFRHGLSDLDRTELPVPDEAPLSTAIGTAPGGLAIGE